MSLTLHSSVGRGMFGNIPKKLIVLYYKFNTEDVTGTTVLNYANQIYDASLVNALADQLFKVAGTSSLNIFNADNLIYNLTFTDGGGVGIAEYAGTTFTFSRNYENVSITANIPIYSFTGLNRTVSYYITTAVFLADISVNMSTPITSGTVTVTAGSTNILINTAVIPFLDTGTTYAIVLYEPNNTSVYQTFNLSSIPAITPVLFYSPIRKSTSLRLVANIKVNTLNSNNYFYAGPFKTNVVRGKGMTISFWMKPSNLKSYTTIFELGNGMTTNTLGMYIYRQQLSSVINNLNETTNGYLETTDICSNKFSFPTTISVGTILDAPPWFTYNVSSAPKVRLILTARASSFVYGVNTPTGELYWFYSNYAVDRWSNSYTCFTARPGSATNMCLSEDGTIFMYTIYNTIQYSIWNGSTYTNLRTISSSNSSNSIEKIALSRNKERLIVAYQRSIYYSNYNSATQSYDNLVFDSSINFIENDYIRYIDISPDLNYIVYSTTTSANIGKIYYRKWDGSNYLANETLIFRGGSNTLAYQVSFIYNGNAILALIGNYSNSRLYVWNNTTKSYREIGGMSLQSSSIANMSSPYTNLEGIASFRYDDLNRVNILTNNNIDFFKQSMKTLHRVDISNIDISNSSSNWMHVVWTINMKTDSSYVDMNYYINSSLVKSLQFQNVYFNNDIRTKNYIGTSDISYSFLNNYNGGIDEFAVYNTVLNQTQITNIYNTKTHPII